MSAVYFFKEGGRKIGKLFNHNYRYFRVSQVHETEVYSMGQRISYSTRHDAEVPRTLAEGFSLITISKASRSRKRNDGVIAYSAGVQLDEVSRFGLMLESTIRTTARLWPFIASLSAMVVYYKWPFAG